VLTIILVVVIVNDSGGVGANDPRPPPPTLDGWPADDITTVVVRFPPFVCSPAWPLPILRIVVFIIVFVVAVVFPLPLGGVRLRTQTPSWCRNDRIGVEVG
jgi:hypothetical protein